MAKFIVDLQYFKPTGKFYTEGKIEVPETWQMYQIADHVEKFWRTSRVNKRNKS